MNSTHWSRLFYRTILPFSKSKQQHRSARTHKDANDARLLISTELCSSVCHYTYRSATLLYGTDGSNRWVIRVAESRVERHHISCGLKTSTLSSRPFPFSPRPSIKYLHPNGGVQTRADLPERDGWLIPLIDAKLRPMFYETGIRDYNYNYKTVNDRVVT